MSFFTNFLHGNQHSYELSMKTSRVLLNKAWGQFTFSQTLKSEFEKEYNISIPTHDPFFPNNKDNNSGIDARYDERVLNIRAKIIEELDFNSAFIYTTDIPVDLLPYIHITLDEECEKLTINISKKYKDLLLELIANSEKIAAKKDLLEIEKKIKKYEKYLDTNFIHYI